MYSYTCPLLQGLLYSITVRIYAAYSKGFLYYITVKYIHIPVPCSMGLLYSITVHTYIYCLLQGFPVLHYSTYVQYTVNVPYYRGLLYSITHISLPPGPKGILYSITDT